MILRRSLHVKHGAGHAGRLRSGSDGKTTTSGRWNRAMVLPDNWGSLAGRDALLLILRRDFAGHDVGERTRVRLVRRSVAWLPGLACLVALAAGCGARTVPPDVRSPQPSGVPATPVPAPEPLPPIPAVTASRRYRRRLRVGRRPRRADCDRCAQRTGRSGERAPSDERQRAIAVPSAIRDARPSRLRRAPTSRTGRLVAARRERSHVDRYAARRRPFLGRHAGDDSGRGVELDARGIGGRAAVAGEPHVQSIVPVDDRTLAITLRSEHADAPLVLADASLAIARRSPGSPWPLGTRAVRIAPDQATPTAVAARSSRLPGLRRLHRSTPATTRGRFDSSSLPVATAATSWTKASICC